ncbi:YifB family Mg chelatase-like AAA ATPase [Candidatus Rariloculus sp.]|uniref:YifB family Mg chelatase-like AAA ATPase n=1 Tax=Candidatus Rariloculus sp. TaxID=3101265 RepID=UPI003D0E59E6
MSLARLISRGQSGLTAFEVAVEVHLAGGLPSFAITGLPTAAVRESRDRVRAALHTSGLPIPASRITAHLGPADVPKDGGRFDLAIALGVVKAAGKLAWNLDDTEFIGELALGGELRPVTGALPAVLAARAAKRRMILPAANADEAALVEDAEVYYASHLNEVMDHLNGSAGLPRVTPRKPPRARLRAADLSDVRGHAAAKRALTVAAAGGHNLLMVGPPGSGKSMLAERLRGLIPPLDWESALRVASIASVAGDRSALINGIDPPFRAPHHTTSAHALVGGGSRPRPGEVSLAHCGVLFLDELAEFSRVALEALREPMESGVVRISRVREQVSFPARFQLVAAMNPCPCGYLGDGTDRCRCSLTRLQQYQGRVSGPLLDRFDLHIEVPQVSFGDLASDSARGESAELGQRIAAAREQQLARDGCLNAHLDDASVWRAVPLDRDSRALLKQAVEKWQLSARGAVRVLKSARTIADLDGTAKPGVSHLAEALQMRCLDRTR